MTELTGELCWHKVDKKLYCEIGYETVTLDKVDGTIILGQCQWALIH